MPKTPIDYSKACVYRLIYNHITYYVGSTTNMRLRKSQHRVDSNYDNRPLYVFIRETGGWDNGWSMILIENYPECKTSDELRKYERHHYDIYKPSLKNMKKPHTTVDEVEEYRKQYCIENKDKKDEYHKQYRIENKDKIQESNKQYRIDEKNKIGKKTNCVCGGKYIHNHKTRHFRTLKHTKYLEQNFTDV